VVVLQQLQIKVEQGMALLLPQVVVRLQLIQVAVVAVRQALVLVTAAMVAQA
jgi:hypothetical protein